MIDALFWDNDGVLVDTEHLFFRANREVLAEMGVELSEEVFCDISLRRGRSVLEVVEGASAEELEGLRRRRNDRYAGLLREGVQVIDGVEECLTTLYGRVPMAIVTSANPDHFEAIHARTGLLRFFEFSLRSGDYRRHKPHPEPYLTAAARLDVDPARCVVVEDSERGVEAAARAGMRCLAIPNPLTRQGDFAAAHAVLDCVSEVPANLELAALGSVPGA